MRGKILEVRVGTDQILLIRLDNGMMKRRRVDERAVITLAGKDAGFIDLRPGDIVEFEGQPIVKLTATRP